LHPEAKFDNGDYTDIGITKRKRIYANGVEHIGKEANRLEDQWFLGYVPEAQTVYRLPKKDFEKLAATTIREARKYSQRELARASGYSLREVSRLICGKVATTPQAVARIQTAINTLEKEKKETNEILSRTQEVCRQIGLRRFAQQAGLDPANLIHTLKKKRRPSTEMLAKLQRTLGKLQLKE
jgi:transcriptional regulator with XRE-family HTH domain